MTPHIDLTGYLAELADLLGYDIDLDQLEPATGIHPHMVVEWATTGTAHASLAYTRNLLAGPIAFLQQHTERTSSGSGSGSRDISDLDLSLLAELRAQDQRLDETLDAASRRYAAACHALVHTGLVWQRVADEHTDSRPANASADDQRPADTTTTHPPLDATGASATEPTGAGVIESTGAAAPDPPDRVADRFWTPWGGWADSIEDALGIPPE